MKIVIDANVLVALAVPMTSSARAAERLDGWLKAGAELFAPALWSYEAVSAIRKFVAAGALQQEEAFVAVSHFLAIGIQDIAPSEDLHRKALIWADRLADFVAYDPAYLATAESMNAPFWTADGKLVKKVRALGVDWIHDISETEGEVATPAD